MRLKSNQGISELSILVLDDRQAYASKPGHGRLNSFLYELGCGELRGERGLWSAAARSVCVSVASPSSSFANRLNARERKEMIKLNWNSFPASDRKAHVIDRKARDSKMASGFRSVGDRSRSATKLIATRGRQDSESAVSG